MAVDAVVAVNSVKFGAPVFPENDDMVRNCGEKTVFEFTHFLRLLSVTMHSTSSSLQLVQGAPCSTTLHRTFLARQH
jgi:hypothetical protein